MPYLMREALLDGMHDQPGAMQNINDSFDEFMQILQEKDIYKFSERMTKFQDDKNKVQNLQYKYILGVNQTLKSNFSGRKLSIQISMQDIKDSYSLIPYQGSLGLYKFEGVVASAHWDQLPNQRGSHVDIMDHLDKLLVKEDEVVPKNNKKKGIGLITFQNGINNTFIDFQRIGKSILAELKKDEKPLCIGIYNPAKGIVKDLFGVLAGLEGNLSEITCCSYEFFAQLAAKISSINPLLLWAHFAHSEGGLIAKSVLSMISRNQLRQYFKDHLLVATYGAVLPTPKEHAKEAINSYSTTDTATWPRVQSYLQSLSKSSDAYKIIPLAPTKTPSTEIVKPSAELFAKMTPIERCIVAPVLTLTSAAGAAAAYLAANAVRFYANGGDHAFDGDTYKQALMSNMKEFRQDYTIYDAKKKPAKVSDLGRRSF